MRYSLVDYILTISIPQKLRSVLGITTISIGGEGSYTDNFSFSMNNPTWQTNGDATGSWVHSKSLDRTGNAAISLSMLSPQVVRLTRLFNLYFSSEMLDEGVAITLSDASSNTVVTCNDCFITKLPDITIQETPQQRVWTFTCGQIIIN